MMPGERNGKGCKTQENYVLLKYVFGIQHYIMAAGRAFFFAFLFHSIA
jgi:hypothetical protein